MKQRASIATSPSAAATEARSNLVEMEDACIHEELKTTWPTSAEDREGHCSQCVGFSYCNAFLASTTFRWRSAWSMFYSTIDDRQLDAGPVFTVSVFVYFSILVFVCFFTTLSVLSPSFFQSFCCLTGVSVLSSLGYSLLRG